MNKNIFRNKNIKHLVKCNKDAKEMKAFKVKHFQIFIVLLRFKSFN